MKKTINDQSGNQAQAKNERQKDSPYRLLGVGAIWIIWAAALPMYRPIDFLTLIVVSAMAYILFEFVFSNIVFFDEIDRISAETEASIEITGKTTGDLIDDIDKYVLYFKTTDGISKDDNILIGARWHIIKQNCAKLSEKVYDAIQYSGEDSEFMRKCKTTEERINNRIFSYHIPELYKKCVICNSVLTNPYVDTASDRIKEVVADLSRFFYMTMEATRVYVDNADGKTGLPKYSEFMRDVARESNKAAHRACFLKVFSQNP